MHDTGGRTRELHEMLAHACWPSALEGTGIGLFSLYLVLADDLQLLPPGEVDEPLDDWIARAGRPGHWPSFELFRAQTDDERQLFTDLVRAAHEVVSSNRSAVLELLVDCVVRTRRRPGLKMELRSAAHRITTRVRYRNQLERDADETPSPEEVRRLCLAADQATDDLRGLESDFLALISPAEPSAQQFTHPGGPSWIRPARPRTRVRRR